MSAKANGRSEAMVKVHSFRAYDVRNDEYAYPQRKSTKERIERIRGEIIPGTGIDVPEYEVDAEGKHVGPPPRTGLQTEVGS